MTNVILSGSCLVKAGTNVSSEFTATPTTLTDPAWDPLIQEAEAEINATTRYNWTDNYATLNDDVKFFFQEAVASTAAMSAIAWDMSGYGSREAETKLDVLLDVKKNAINQLKEIKVRDFVTNA